MAEGRGDGGRGSEASDGGDAARCGGLAAARQHLPALRPRSLGAAVATPSCPGECHRGALRRRSRRRLRAPGRRRAVSGGPATAVGKLCAQSASGQDAPDRVRPPCGGEPRAARLWQAGDLPLPGLHPHLRAKLREVKETLRRRLHAPINEQGTWLQQVVRGYFAYHAVPNNIQALAAFRRGIKWLWWRSLRRRSEKDRTTRSAINRLVARWLPKPGITHPWPEKRFAVTHPRWEPDARIGHVRFCAGGAQ